MKLSKSTLFATTALILGLSPYFSFSGVFATSPTVDTLSLSIPIVNVPSSAATSQMNQTIQSYIAQQYPAQTLSIIREGNLTYRVTYEDANVISLLINSYVYTGGAHGMHRDQGLVFNKKTGQLLPLRYFVHVPSMQAIYQGLVKGTLPFSNIQGQTLTFDPQFHSPDVAIPTSYILTGHGAIGLVFQPYELAPYSDGTTVVTIPATIIQEWNKK